MNKRIVLKSVLAVVMVGFILSVSSCQKDEKKIIGVWKYEKIELKEFSCSNPFVEAMVKMSFQMNAGVLVKEMGLETVEFTKDGKVISKNETVKYKIDGDKLTITGSENISGTFDISFPDKKQMYWNMNMLELYGEYAAELIKDGVTKFVVQITFAKQ